MKLRTILKNIKRRWRLMRFKKKIKTLENKELQSIWKYALDKEKYEALPIIEAEITKRGMSVISRINRANFNDRSFQV